ncbi:CHAT domain-containing protein [Dyadobacter diqingensis]|uniref:CHAT domain-containing protein n=1 Tax=Dyadobacter diqingensis TaxID=2938121 RepID=UPI0020C1A60A|nr:CHAT domain-containing tetratricopeptide repeat protein [Dyadobacter diqingensis]
MYFSSVRIYWWIITMCLFLHTSAFGSLGSILKLRADAEALYDDEKFKEATVVYKKAFSKCIEGGFPELGTTLLVDLSSMEHLNGNYREGIALCHQGMQLLKKVAQPADSSVFKLNASLGELYRQLQYIDSAAFYFDTADRLLNKNPKLTDQITEYVIYHFSNQSMLHELVGRFSLSEKLAVKALHLTQDYHLPDDEAIIRNVLAGQLEKTGKFAQAMELRRSGLATYKPEDLQKARMYSGIGRNALYQKKYGESLRYLLRSYKLYTDLRKKKSEQDDSKKLIALCNHLGRCYMSLGMYERAQFFFEKGIRIHENKYGKRGLLIADCWLMKCQIEELRDNRTSALQYCQVALSAITLPNSRLDKWENPTPDDVLNERLAMQILSFKGSLLNRNKAFEKSLATYQRAVEVFHHARRQLYLLEDKLYLSETVIPVHREAQEVAYQYYKTNRTKSAFDAAFRLLEQVRATALQDFTAETFLRPRYLDAKQIRAEIALRQELVRVRSDLLSDAPEKERRELIEKESRLRHEHYRLLHSWEMEHATYFQSRFQIDSLNIKQVQGQLTKRAAYLTFGYQKGKLHLFAITKEHSIWKTISVDSSTLFSTMAVLRQAIAKHPDVKGYHGTPAALHGYEWFIAPLLSLIEAKDEWIINSGGVLDGLPVEVFETGKRANDYLAKHFTIRYVYSAATLRSEAGPPIGTTPASLTLAPFHADVPSHIKAPYRYETLLLSRQSVLNPTDKLLVNEEATLSAFRKEYTKYPVWYLSTHARLDLAEPMRSYIAFFPQENSDSHKLYAGEISQMDLRHVKLASLSACETGGGKVNQTEGIMSLARAFAYAGCPVTINTLWTAQDRSSVNFFQRFRQHLEEGDSPALSLRKARNDFFASPENNAYNHPYFWANFVVVGSNAPVYPSQPLAPWKIAGILVGILAICSTCYVLQKNFRR